MYVLAFYDITDDGRRQKIADRLLAKGFARVQRSVYLARGGKAFAKDVVRGLARLVVDVNDSLFVVVVPAESIRNMLAVGRTYVEFGDYAML